MHISSLKINNHIYQNLHQIPFSSSRFPEKEDSKSEIISQYMQILSEPTESSRMKSEGIQTLKNDCIEQLQDNNLKKLCLNVLKKSPVEMFVVPSSSQGKNHPSDEFYPGSMIKHVKRSFQVAKYSTLRHGLDSTDTDIMLAATLLHDFPAKFIPDGEKAYKKDIDHAVKNAIFIENEMKKMKFNEQTIKKLCAGVGFHTGRFDRHINEDWLKKYKSYQNTPYANVVQEADFYASRPMVFVKTN